MVIHSFIDILSPSRLYNHFYDIKSILFEEKKKTWKRQRLFSEIVDITPRMSMVEWQNSL